MREKRYDFNPYYRGTVKLWHDYTTDELKELLRIYWRDRHLEFYRTRVKWVIQALREKRSALF